EHAGVIATQAQGGLRQVVCAVGEKLRLTRNRISDKDCTRQLDHGTHQKGHTDTFLAHDALGNCVDMSLNDFQLFEMADEGHLDPSLHPHTVKLEPACRFHDRLHLHVVNIWYGNAQAAAAVP